MSDILRKKTASRDLFSLTEVEILALYESRAGGLSDDEAHERHAYYGANTFRTTKKRTAITVFAEQFTSPLIFLLVGAAILTSVLGEHVDTVVIVLAIIINTALGFYQEYKAGETLEKLTAYIKDRSRVLRSDQEKEIDSGMLVPGDIMRLSLGMRVPADGRIISCTTFSVDESVLTGESLPITKNALPGTTGSIISEQTNMVHAGSLVVEGYATVLVTTIGSETEIGRIAELVNTGVTESTPLQKSLNSLSWVIFAGVMLVVALLFVLGIAKGEPVLDMLLLASAVAVGAIPEALPIALTVILTAGIARIAKHNGIVRKLSAAETLGSTTLVMTDKTGTLTEAKMQLTAVLSVDELFEGAMTTELVQFTESQKAIIASALLSTDVVIENPTEPKKDWRLIGRPLEVNIVRAAADAGIDVVAVRKNTEKPILPFNSTNKFSVVYDKDARSHIVLGAPDILLARSVLSIEERTRLESRIHTIASEGKRLLGVARLPEISIGYLPSGAVDPDSIDELSFVGALVLYDPIRPEVAQAVARIERYGARVVMVTGDIKGTAMAIARELGWTVSDEQVLTGIELRALSDKALEQSVTKYKLFSRVTPEDKLRIGKAFQARGEIVAMTGDGVNDAPSLQAADIGVALGSGSDVAKSAADLVVLDDNFETIVIAIEEGRRVVANIRKAFAYLMSNCLDEVILVGGSLIAGLSMPLSALQIIWVNFFTGSLTALSYAFEQNRDVGYGHGEKVQRIFNKEVQLITFVVGLVTSLLLFALYSEMLSRGVDLAEARTVLFACFASYALLIGFSFKSLHLSIFSYDIFDNRALNLSLVFSAVMVVLSLAVPQLRQILALAPIKPVWILVVVGWLFLNMAIVEVVKWVIGKYMRQSLKTQ